ncbi:MAG: enoyl-CoA hydratase/isomerase family protein [Bryobacteraceae bacterium]|nr:enoyl-CoA hydratase/isomerase family protein [Bryobacteraceae bacterium]
MSKNMVAGRAAFAITSPYVGADQVRVGLDGSIATITLSGNGAPYVHTESAAGQLKAAFDDLSANPVLRVLVLTGTEEAFALADPEPAPEADRRGSKNSLLTSFLDIGVPSICVVSGRAYACTELIAASDIVLMSSGAEIRDREHVERGIPPTAPVALVWRKALGHQRAKGFLLTGRAISADEALTLGLAAEVLPYNQAVERARHYASRLSRLPAIGLRNTRDALAHELRRELRSAQKSDSPGLPYPAPAASPVAGSPSYAAAHASWTRMERDALGILTVTLQTEGDSLSWGADSFAAHDLFRDIVNDAAVRAVIITGSGKAFCDRPLLKDILPFFAQITPQAMDYFFRNGPRSLDAQFDLAVPVVLAVNGPATVHEEFFLSADVILASEDASFQDGNHIPSGFSVAGTPTFWTELLGPVRGRYFLMTGETLSSKQALALGLVSEITRNADLLSRARFHAERLAQLPRNALLGSRVNLNAHLRQRTFEEVRTNGALFSLSNLDKGGPFATSTQNFDQKRWALDIASPCRSQDLRFADPDQRRFATLDRSAEGVLQVRLHNEEGGPLQPSPSAMLELARLWREIASDSSARVVIIYGFGGISPDADPSGESTGAARGAWRMAEASAEYDRALASVAVPVIAAVDGRTHFCGTVFAADIVLASENAVLTIGAVRPATVPAGLELLFLQACLGSPRASSAFLLGREFSATEAQAVGLVNEVLEPPRLLGRAHAIAGALVRHQTDLVLKTARSALNHYYRKLLFPLSEYTYALRALAGLDALSSLDTNGGHAP